MLARVAVTLGDVSGIGPEVIVRAWCGVPGEVARALVVVGHPDVLRRAIALVGADLTVHQVDDIRTCDAGQATISCWNPTDNDAASVPPSKNDARAGRAAYEYLNAAAKAALAGEVDAIVTAPLSKAALHMAGLKYPGHTEILAELCSVRDCGMMLYLPENRSHGLGVIHATLHTSIRSVPGLLSTPLVLEKIRLIDRFLKTLDCVEPRLAVCALNPHAGEEGLFGDEESRTIAPAVREAAAEGVSVIGPLPADTLMKRALAGEFDGIVAMYHDQGHIAVKLAGFDRAVNVTLGLPIVRTSPSHGTAFDIAWKGVARPDGMIEAIRVAQKLAVRARKASGCG